MQNKTNCTLCSGECIFNHETIISLKCKSIESLPMYNLKGGELFVGLKLICEKNLQSKLQIGILKDWEIGSAKIDINGLGKYHNSTAYVDINGSVEPWPFTMLYVKS